jgi:hypothetical protein
MTTSRAERPWWEDMPIEKHHYREGRGIPMKQQKCMDTMTEIRRLNEATRVRRNEERGISVLKEIAK